MKGEGEILNKRRKERREKGTADQGEEEKEREEEEEEEENGAQAPLSWFWIGYWAIYMYFYPLI